MDRHGLLSNSVLRFMYSNRNVEDPDVCGVDKAVLDSCEQELKEMFRFAELLKQALVKEVECFGEFKSWLAASKIALLFSCTQWRVLKFVGSNMVVLLCP